MKGFLKFTLGLVLLLLFLGAGTAAVAWYLWSSNLPYIGSLRDYSPPIITEIYSAEGEVIGRFAEEKRIVVTLDQVPQHLIYAFVAAEDARFFEHEGVDLQSIVRAFFKNLQAGKIAQGGSTITQQVTKSLLLRNTERTYRRKVREAILSMQIEKNFSKEEILFLYLNQIYLGHGAYGVEAAARTYFNKPAKELNLAEAALLAGLPQAPSRYSPISHFQLTKARQRYVLERMREEGNISETEARDAYDATLDFQTWEENPFERAPYFTEHIRQYVLEKYGKELLYRGGLRVYTTLEVKTQTEAKKALTKGLFELDKREGYRGPLRHLEAAEIQGYKQEAVEKWKDTSIELGAVVEALVEKVDDKHGMVIVHFGEREGRLPLARMKWARKPNREVAYYAVEVKKPSDVLKEGDVILVRLEESKGKSDAWEVSLEQIPEVQGALFCMEPETGKVKAMVGGRDFALSQFNRAVQSRRQPGSAFKPIIYAAALDQGMGPTEILMDAPYISQEGSSDEAWKPKNYTERFFGPTLFRTALTQSRNVITVKIVDRIGVKYVIDYARKMGIESNLNADLSLALGSSGVSLMEITKAYSIFANGGKSVEPIFIERIIDRSGRVIEEGHSEVREVLSKETSYVITDLMKAVIQEGTGWRIKALKRPAAGKTGTTNDLRDAWFIGYTPELVTGVWVGYDDLQPMGKGETGSRAASPIWLYFMSEVLNGRPIRDFTVPEGVVFAKIDEKTGLLASRDSEKTVFQAFKEGEEPKEYSVKASSPKSRQFLQFDLESGK